MPAARPAPRRTRGRPAQGKGLELEDILSAAQQLLDEEGCDALTMRALAARLGVTPMSLYHHVGDRAGLIRAVADRVYADVGKRLRRAEDDPLVELRSILLRYHECVARQPQLTLALFTESGAFAGVSRSLSERMQVLLEPVVTDAQLWRDVLVDHAHGNALAFASASPAPYRAMRRQYTKALDALLQRLRASRS